VAALFPSRTADIPLTTIWRMPLSFDEKKENNPADYFFTNQLAFANYNLYFAAAAVKQSNQIISRRILHENCIDWQSQ
jgi:hypothetical protein